MMSAEPPALMGDYIGSFTESPKGSSAAINSSLAVRVVGRANDQFEIQVLNEFDKRAFLLLEDLQKLQNGGLNIEKSGWQLEVRDGKISGSQLVKIKGKDVEVPLQLEKVERQSPTLGKPAPEGAIELFADGVEKWQHGQDKPATWKVIEDGVIEAFPRRRGNKAGGDLRTKETFRDCEIHIEFQLPYEPGNSGQGRSNSGIFIQEVYEVQILDSYGSQGMWDEAGALYRVSPPKVNASYPPGSWQTYDITFRAARYAEDGELLENPVISVLHNGVPIHTNYELREITQYREADRKQAPRKEAGPIILQDHGHPIRFRNAWVKPM